MITLQGDFAVSWCTSCTQSLQISPQSLNGFFISEFFFVMELVPRFFFLSQICGPVIFSFPGEIHAYTVFSLIEILDHQFNRAFC